MTARKTKDLAYSLYNEDEGYKRILSLSVLFSLASERQVINQDKDGQVNHAKGGWGFGASYKNRA